MIRDRGNKKWVSLMLPEHVTMLRHWKNEDRKQVKRELDEQELEQLNDVMMEAIADNKEVKLTIYDERQYTEKQLIGTIIGFDELNQRIKVMTCKGERTTVALANVIHCQE